MCGIAGVVGHGMTVNYDARKAAARLHHRGPDSQGTHQFRHCSLGHARLRVIDLSPLGDQPMCNEEQTVWVVFNGELYNFIELRRSLELLGHRFRTDTDTEVLIHLYEEEGSRITDHLRGMFAFAIWDERVRRLLLCRDRLGIKPLYFRTTDDRLEFASEVQALAQPTDTLNASALDSFLRLGWVTGPTTILSEIEELPPAHRLVWEAGMVDIRSYWQPTFGRGHQPPSINALAEALRDSVRRQLVADVPVGLFLSSGVDSAVIASLASDLSPGIRGYTVTFDGAADEGADAAALAEQLEIEHVCVHVSGEEVLSSLDSVIADMDQPTVDGVNSWIISRAVRNAGLVVALSGLGGDELFAGYSTFRHVPRMMTATRVARMIPHFLLSGVLKTMASSQFVRHSREQRVMEAIQQGRWEPNYAAVRGLFSAAELYEIWNAGLAPSCHISIPWDHRVRDRMMVMQLELGNYLPNQLLRDTDCMSMAHSLEVRVPLLDESVVELAALAQSSRLGWSKRDLVCAADPTLLYLVDQPKKTFTLPFGQWMYGALRQRVLGALTRLGEDELGFNRRELTNLWDGFLNGHVGWRPIWALAVLGIWLEAHDQSIFTQDSETDQAKRLVG